MRRGVGCCFLLCVLCGLASHAAIPQSEAEALMALYAATDGPGWANNSGWGIAGIECDWYGVGCDLTEEHVIILDLNDNLLQGAIPGQIGDLEFLTLLALNFNQLGGTIPPELGNLSNLNLLDLSYNELEGPIPAQLGNLGSLWDLWLSHNRLSGEIPTQLANLVSLRALSLYENHLTGYIPGWLGTFPDLWLLDLSNNQLEGEIPYQLGDLANLTMLSLQANRLSGSLAPELGSLSDLDTLWLHSNGLVGTIPTGLTSVVGSDFRWNGLYTATGPWDDCQTVAPDNVTATARGPTSVLVTWTPIPYTANDGGYRVRYSTSPGGSFTTYADTTDKTVSAMTVSGLDPGTTYFFKVRSLTGPHAVNDCEVVSRPSDIVSATTDPAGNGTLVLAVDAAVGSEGETKAITVRRLEGAAGTVTVQWSTVPGTADPGSDYQAASGTLSWGDGDAEDRTLSIELHDDVLPEGGETLSISLSGATGGAVLGSPSSTVLTIQDSDIPPAGEADTNSTGSQPAVAADLVGNRLVVWSGPDQDGTTLAILGQLYNPWGQTTGNRLVISQARASQKFSPSIAHGGADGFVVTWISETGSKQRAEDEVVALWLEPDGSPGSGELHVNSEPFAEVTEVVVSARRSDGTALVVWHGRPLAAGNQGIFARLVDSSGAPVSAQLTVDDGAAGAVRAPAVATNDLGDAVVAWARADDEGWDDVVARRFDSVGNPLGTEIAVNLDTFRHQTEPAVVVESDGDFVVAWHGPTLPTSPESRQVETDIHARRFSSTGTPEGDPFRVNSSQPNAQRHPVLLIDSNDDCWAAWEEEGMGAVWAYAVSMPSCQVPVGGETLINDPGDTGSLRSLKAAVADDSAVTAVYVKDDVNEGDGSIVARALNQSDGLIFGDDFESGGTSAWSAVRP